MASDKKIGGGWLNGAGAQEETLFYRSSYYLSMKRLQNKYPLQLFNQILSQNVLVFRDKNYNLLDENKFYSLDFIAVAALRKPRLKNGLFTDNQRKICLLYTSPSPRDAHESRMPSSA